MNDAPDAPGAPGPVRQPLQVVAGIVVEHGRVLVAQRHRDQSFPLLWEFPGGKVEAGETPEDALAREFREELGIAVEARRAYGVIEYPGGDGTPIRVRFFLARRLEGSPRALEVEAVAWVPATDLPRVDFIPANREIVNRLREDLQGETGLEAGDSRGEGNP